MHMQCCACMLHVAHALAGASWHPSGHCRSSTNVSVRVHLAPAAHPWHVAGALALFAPHPGSNPKTPQIYPKPQPCGAPQNTSELVREALAHVRAAHPHWDRRGGADHFMVFSFDHARCDLAAGLSSAELGQMFSVQSYGDLTST